MVDAVFRNQIQFTYFNTSTTDGAEEFNNITFMHKQYILESSPPLADLLFNGTNQYIVDDTNYSVNWYLFSGDTVDVERISIFPRIRLTGLTNGTIRITAQHHNFHGQWSNIINVEFELGAYYHEEPIATLNDMSIEREGVNATVIAGITDYDTYLTDYSVQANASLTDYDSNSTKVNQAPTDEDDENNIVDGLIIWLNGTQVYNSFNITYPTADISTTKIYRADKTIVQDDEVLYENEVYTLSITAQSSTYLDINMSDAQRTIGFHWNNDTKRIYTTTSDNGEYVIGLLRTSYNQSIQGTWGMYNWTFILDRNIVDSYGVEWNVKNNSTTVLASGFVVYKMAFVTVDIYNLGGRVSYYYEYGGSRIVGGDSFELEVTNTNDYARAEVIYDKLQHVGMLVELWTGATWYPSNNTFGNIQGCAYQFGIQYEIDNEWHSGWYALLYVQDVDSYIVGHQLAGDDMDWVRWNVDWYNEDGMVKRDYIYSNFWGYETEDGKPDNLPRHSTQMHINLWFNRMNASTVVGGRINSYYFGFYELGNPWWFGYGEFRPMIGNISSSMFFTNLYDNDSNIRNAGEIQRVRYYTAIARVNNHNITSRMMNYEMLNFKVADDRMVGVDTPVLVETKVVDMPQGGFLTPLIKVMESIGNLIWAGAFSFIRLFMGAIDTLLTYFGLPMGTFTQLMDMLSIRLTMVFSWLGLIVKYAVDMLYVFTSMLNWTLSFMAYILEGIVWLVVWVIPIPIHVIRFLYALLTSSTFTYMGFNWDFISGKEIMEAGYAILPYTLSYVFLMWLFFGGEDSDDLLGTPRRIVFVFESLRGAYQNVFWFLISAQNKIMSMYNFIRSHIPALGSGGGEEDEG